LERINNDGFAGRSCYNKESSFWDGDWLCDELQPFFLDHASRVIVNEPEELVLIFSITHELCYLLCSGYM
jgi:hypothetical protein